MRKIKLRTFTVIALGFLIFTSCSTENNSKNSIDEDLIAKSLTFKKIDFDATATEDNRASGRICIVGWDEWGRASRDCRGWGLCNAVWFDCEDEQRFEYEGAYSSPLYFDETNGKYYVEVLLASSTEIPIEDLTLKIDESFELDTELVIDKNLIFSQGNYIFNESPGDYGGIRIYLD